MKNVFNQFYKDYDEWYESVPGAYVDQVETSVLWELLNPIAGMEILDVGCGTGHQSMKLAHLGCRVTGIDIASNMLKEAEKKNQCESLAVDFYEMNCEQMNFADDSFDAAISMAALEFIQNPCGAFDEMRRVVKPGGSIVIGTIQKGGHWAKFYESEAFLGTAFAFARFLSLDDMYKFDKIGFDTFKECLFVSPEEPKESYTIQREQALSTTGKKGGFLCVRFK